MPKINNLDEAAEAVLDAQQQKHRLELRGLGTKTGIGNQPDYDACLDVSAMQGIVEEHRLQNDDHLTQQCAIAHPGQGMERRL